MVAKAWQHHSGTVAKFTGQDFPPKKLCTAHQERWTTFLRVPLHHYSKACQTLFRWNLFVRFFEVTRELRQCRLWETFLDHAALSGPRVQIGRTMSELGPSRTILASLQSIVNQT